MKEQDFEQLTLYREDSPVSPSPLPGGEEATRMTVTSGRKCLELYRNSSPLGSLAKMLLESSTWNSNVCFLTWKVKAMPSGRILFRLVPSTPRTGGNGSPLLPTPTVSDCKGSGPCGSKSAKYDLEKHNLKGVVMFYPSPTTGFGLCGGTITEKERRSMSQGNGGHLNPDWVEKLMGFPAGWTRLDEDG